MKLVFMLEERSMEEFLKGLMSRWFPAVDWVAVPHEGKQNLQKSIPKKLRAWREPNVRFVIVHDQDAARCKDIKSKLVRLCEDAGRSDCLVRIPCRELESWFLGDLAAVEAAMEVKGLKERQDSRKFRDPDKLGNPSEELRKMVPRYQKISGARAIGRHLDIENNRSHSYNVFVQGIRKALSSGP